MVVKMSTRLRYILEKIAVDIDKLKEVNRKALGDFDEVNGAIQVPTSRHNTSVQRIADKLVKDKLLTPAKRDRFVEQYNNFYDQFKQGAANEVGAWTMPKGNVIGGLLEHVEGKDASDKFLAKMNGNRKYKRELLSHASPILSAKEENPALRELYLAHELSENRTADKRLNVLYQH
jgi:hypothetical protein